MINRSQRRKFQKKLLAWYQDNARDLPWRRTRDPYLIWVSEVMLQQTRVETVIPYYLRWIERFPTLEALAAAPQDEVLSCWEGLGYYRRALHLHQAVKEVAASYQGLLPADPSRLRKLPGIGPYTAGAISSIAFNQPAPILDGNIRRVFSRLFYIEAPLNSSESDQLLGQIAGELLPAEDPGTFNQALMELGALVCLPRKPDCSRCPLREECIAQQREHQDRLPVKLAAAPLPHIQVAAAVCLKNDRVLLTKRPPGGLLGGMWEYPGGKQERGETLTQTLQREILEELNAQIEVEGLLGVYHHAYTHYKVTLQAFYCQLLTEELVLNYHLDFAWVELESLADYPMGKLDRLISSQLRDASQRS